MNIEFDLYPQGKHKALTFSCDGGGEHALRLARIFDFSGIRGTFHLQESRSGDARHLTPYAIKTALAAHEVSCHTAFLTAALPEALTAEIVKSKQTLERICGYPIRGISHSHHEADHALVTHLRKLGICYARTTRSTEEFSLPEDFMHWHPTCHHNSPHLRELLAQFRTTKIRLALFSVQVQNHELAHDGNCSRIEEFCTAAADNPDVWYATSIEIYDYIMALQALCFSADRTMVYNPTATDVWMTADGAPVRVASGATVHLNT